MEELIETVGSFGRFQIMTVLLVKSSDYFLSFTMMIMVFGAVEPDWWCIENNETLTSLNATAISYKNCSYNPTSTCERVFEDYTRTIVSEFGLVCESKWVTPTIIMIQMFGVLLGAGLGGQAGDFWGRKPTFYFTILIHATLNFLVIVSTTWKIFALFRFFIGLTSGILFVVNVYPIEFVGIHRRALVGALPFWAIGSCLLALVAYLVPDWKSIHIVIGGLTIVYIFGWFIIPESVRWLATQGRIEEAKKVIEKICRINKKPLPQNTEAILRLTADQEKQAQKYTYLDIFRGRAMLRKTLPIGAMWTACSAVFYGISFGISALSGNFYLNLFLMSLAPLPMAPPFIYLNNRFGRMYNTAVPLFIGCILCFIVIVIQEVMDVTKSPAITAVCITVQFLNIWSWNTIGILTVESYPTVVRNLGTGSANTFARIGGMIAPFIFSDSSHRTVPYVIVIILMIFSGASVFLLRETNKIPLEDTIRTKLNNEPVDDVLLPSTTVERAYCT